MEVVYTAQIDSPVGPLRLVSTARGLGYVELPHASGRGLEGWLRRSLPGARAESGFAPNRGAAVQLVEYFEGKRTAFDLALDPRGTPFQREVWRCLLAIPYGETRSYTEVATAVGRPAAVRAVGSANGTNPLAVVIPCHRVIAADGSLGGYGGGLELKARLLAMERSRSPGPRLL